MKVHFIEKHSSRYDTTPEITKASEKNNTLFIVYKLIKKKSVSIERGLGRL